MPGDDEGATQVKVRITQIDYVLDTPGQLDNCSLPRVPVIRIFGSSSVGKTTCVHIHQIYPYIYIEYPGKLDPQHVRQYMSRLARSLNHAVAYSLKKDPTSLKSQFVRAITLVKGVDFYGFHAAYSPFLKIYAVNPAYMPRMVSVLQSGSVMGSRFRVFESHINYILQFLCDFDLYGCGTINLKGGLQRCPDEPGDVTGTSSSELKTIKLAPSPYFRASRVPLEIDIIPAFILNRHRLSPRNIHHQLKLLPTDVPSDHLLRSVRELWDDERKYRQTLGLNPSPEMPVDPAIFSQDIEGHWVSEARWWEGLREKIESERMAPSMELGTESNSWQQIVPTTFESVEALWDEENIHISSARKKLHPDYIWDVQSELNVTEDVQAEVDISIFSDQEMNRLDQEEREHWDGEAQYHAEGDEEDGDIDEQDDNAHEEEAQPDSPTIVPEDLGSENENPFFDSAITPPEENQEYALKELPSPSAPAHTVDREGSLTPTKEVQDIIQDLQVTPSQNYGRPQRQPDIVLHVTSEMEPLVPLNEHDQISQCNASGKEPTGEIALSPEKRLSLITARAVKLSKAYDNCRSTNSNQYIFSTPPPSYATLVMELRSMGLPSKIYQPPHYSREEDIPEQPKEYAGLLYQIKGGQGIATLEEWIPHKQETTINTLNPVGALDPSGIGGWEYADHPPSAKEIRRSTGQCLDTKVLPSFKSQIEGPTQLSGFRPILRNGNKHPIRQSVHMSILSVEIFVPTIGDKVPDPKINDVAAIFCTYQVSTAADYQTSVLVLEDSPMAINRIRYSNLIEVKDELALLNTLVDIVLDLDPDILTGWEVQSGSWGYLEARGATMEFSVTELISRAPPRHTSGGSIDQWATRKASTLKVTGRQVLNLWRLMRSEKSLTTYTFEHTVAEVLHRRIPKYSYQTLTLWYNSEAPRHAAYLYEYLSMRVMVNLQLLEATELITKTAEFARVFGVDFFSVLSRGSQFKVESFMFRLAKPENFVLFSPSKVDVGRQNAAECMPLIMEPQSAFYSSPLLVLDFQSLYPSLMIAYNYCYSTCLGRVKEFEGRNQFGVVPDLELPPHLLEKLQDHITVSPNGMIYVKSNVRKGLLGRMLVELLDTRVMVKQAMKRPGIDKVRKQILDARQKSLKYIANVIYGYTSASFSGRMPAVEVADSIVQSGRETLEKAIDLIDSTAKWGAKVVYGDTDSVFVYLPGKTKEEAFGIGYEMADKITSMNPPPVKIKFEKVYLPCVLMAKKRYVGFKYESINDVEPIFDAKGIETVRRDGVLAQRKMVENCLKILFRSQDLSEVKDYCWRTWTKLLENRAPVHDFIFAKEVKMGTYSDKGVPPPGVAIAARKMVVDPNDEPRYGDRVPYVIVRSSTGARLVDRAMDPLDFMNNSELRLDGVYYITRVLIPPLERIFNLVGADVQQWYNEMPKVIVPELVSPKKPSRSQITSSPEHADILHGHFFSSQCLSCGELGSQYLCEECCNATTETLATLNYRIRTREERLKHAQQVCVGCTNVAPSDVVYCESLDCQWFYTRRKAEVGMELVPLLADASEELEDAIYEIEEAGEDGYFSYDDYDIDNIEDRGSLIPLVDEDMEE